MFFIHLKKIISKNHLKKITRTPSRSTAPDTHYIRHALKRTSDIHRSSQGHNFEFQHWSSHKWSVRGVPVKIIKSKWNIQINTGRWSAANLRKNLQTCKKPLRISSWSCWSIGIGVRCPCQRGSTPTWTRKWMRCGVSGMLSRQEFQRILFNTEIYRKSQQNWLRRLSARRNLNWCRE